MTPNFQSAERGTPRNSSFKDYNKFTEHGKSGEREFFGCGSKPGKVLRQYRRRRRRILHILSVLLFAACFLSQSNLFSFEDANGPFETLRWESDYQVAKEMADATSRNLLIYFRAEYDSAALPVDSEERFVKVGKNEIRQLVYASPTPRRLLPIAKACLEFERRVLDETAVVDSLDRYVLLKLSIDATMTGEDGNEVRILDLPAFREMMGLPGLAVLEFEHREAPYFGDTIGILPFLRAGIPTAEQASIFLSLPPGTLTQRMLTYAVRIHPERPQSAVGTPEPVLLKEAGGHSAYQARTRVLGHQNFGSRTARIASALNCIGASEVCAQSWSGEGLYEAAISCVRGWRGSPAHWRAVKAPNRHFGYDMVRGADGVWYATGLFVK